MFFRFSMFSFFDTPTADGVVSHIWTFYFEGYRSSLCSRTSTTVSCTLSCGVFMLYLLCSRMWWFWATSMRTGPMSPRVIWRASVSVKTRTSTGWLEMMLTPQLAPETTTHMTGIYTSFDCLTTIIKAKGEIENLEVYLDKLKWNKLYNKSTGVIENKLFGSVQNSDLWRWHAPGGHTKLCQTL